MFLTAEKNLKILCLQQGFFIKLSTLTVTTVTAITVGKLKGPLLGQILFRLPKDHFWAAKRWSFLRFRRKLDSTKLSF